jgi:hypothetical protein
MMNRTLASIYERLNNDSVLPPPRPHTLSAKARGGFTSTLSLVRDIAVKVRHRVLS